MPIKSVATPASSHTLSLLSHNSNCISHERLCSQCRIKIPALARGLDYYHPFYLVSRLGAAGSQANANSTFIQRGSNLSNITSVIQLGHKAFSIQGRCDYKVRLTESRHLDTLTCFVFPKTTNLKDQLEKAYLSYFCDAFLTHVLLVSDETKVDEPAMNLLTSWGCLALFQLPSTENTPPGPYFFSACGLYSAWRIFPDDKDA